MTLQFSVRVLTERMSAIPPQNIVNLWDSWCLNMRLFCQLRFRKFIERTNSISLRVQQRPCNFYTLDLVPRCRDNLSDLISFNYLSDSFLWSLDLYRWFVSLYELVVIFKFILTTVFPSFTREISKHMIIFKAH